MEKYCTMAEQSVDDITAAVCHYREKTSRMQVTCEDAHAHARKFLEINNTDL